MRRALTCHGHPTGYKQYAAHSAGAVGHRHIEMIAACIIKLLLRLPHLASLAAALQPGSALIGLIVIW